jgi:hypothetical protein
MACMMGLSHSVITSRIFLCNNYASQEVTPGVIRNFLDNIHLPANPCCSCKVLPCSTIRRSQTNAPLFEVFANVLCGEPCKCSLRVSSDRADVIIFPVFQCQFEFQKKEMSQVVRAGDFGGAEQHLLVRNICTIKAE